MSVFFQQVECLSFWLDLKRVFLLCWTMGCAWLEIFLSNHLKTDQ
jgi:hypothetical protein